MKDQSILPKGIIAATLTPMNRDLGVDLGHLVSHIRWLLARGADGICLLGTTGEAVSLTVQERMEVIRKVVDAGIEPSKLLIGTSCCALQDTISLTRLAVEAGAGGVLVMPPFYYKGLTDAGVQKTYELLIEGVRDPGLHIYLYHFPKMSGHSFSPALVRKLAKDYPGVIVGIKDSGGDWNHMKEIMKNVPGFRVYAGTEKFLLPTMKAGGAGCISASANITVALCARLFAAWQSPEAGSLQDRLTAARTGLEAAPFVSGLKYLFSVLTGKKDWLNLRPPNALPDEDMRQALEDHLKAISADVMLPAFRDL